MPQAKGPVIIDLIGLELMPEERELLQHPSVGGVILFARNYASTTQITQLCQAIRQSSPSPLLIAVDQEGGRVQRFKEGFVRLPSMGEVGQLYQASPAAGLELAYDCGWIMAAELLAVGVDISFAPVLDLDKQFNTVIGDRSFSANPTTVIRLAEAVIKGMHDAGMAATGKHFPGHGSVKVDSHLALPIDTRSFADIAREDMQPFSALIASGIDALMPAHILFSAVDDQPVGFSRYWLQDILRKQLRFSGVIFSDDLNMAGAAVAGNYSDRAIAALEAGCDSVLICNNRSGAIEIVDYLPEKYQSSAERLQKLYGKSAVDLKTLHATMLWKNKFNSLQEKLCNSPIK
jgi:beta-N-acetylhexosaminidase